ncbi:MAG: IS3 family transposase [Aggregatilineales bacterium]
MGSRSVRCGVRCVSLTRAAKNPFIVTNRLDQHFHAQQSNTLWLTDTTYIPTRDGWLYIVTVLDVCTRQIVGWAMGDHHDAALANAALDMALAHQRPAPGLLLHFDRGSEFANLLYYDTCQAAGIVRSMSRSGNPFDIAMAESFFATLKLEAVQGRVFVSKAEARMVLFDYIEVFYNRTRLHSGLVYATPLSSAA